MNNLKIIKIQKKLKYILKNQLKKIIMSTIFKKNLKTNLKI
jgi:hypothetical protein